MRFLFHELLRLAALALFAAGLSGLLAEPISWKTGTEYLSGDSRAQVDGLSVERCRDLARLHPGKRTCADALVEDHFGELVQYGLVATIAGGVLLLVAGRGRIAPGGHGEKLLHAVLIVGAAVFFAAGAAAALPPGLSGRGELVPGSGRLLLQGAVSALFAALLASEGLSAVRGLTGAKR
jgi:hypothetical protein